MINKLITSLLTVSTLFIYKNSSGQDYSVFIENVGQVQDQHGTPRKDIRYMISDGGASAFIGEHGISYQFSNGKTFCRVDAKLMGATIKSEKIEKIVEPYFENHYYNSKLMGTAKSYSRIVYKDVYPGIDWVLKSGQKNGLEYEFIVHKGADASKINIQYSGASDMRIINGNLQINTPLGNIIEQAPQTYTYQGKLIASQYKLNKGKLSFYITGSTDRLVLDPKVRWCTYYGDTVYNSAYASYTDFVSIKISDKKQLYASGVTDGLKNIATTGAYMTTKPVVVAPSVTYSAYYVKMDTLGKRLYATYFGSSALISQCRLALDGDSVYLGGGDKSNLLATPGADLTSFSPYTAGPFLVKFNDIGLLKWCTYVGGQTNASNLFISTDKAHNVYVSCHTNAGSGLFSTPGSHQPAMADSLDAFLVKFNGSTGKRVWGTYYGGKGNELINGITFMDNDMNGTIYVTGTSTSDTGITTLGAFKSIRPGIRNSFFMVKFDTSGKRQWGSFYGGNLEDYPTSITQDDKKYIYVTGRAQSTSGLSTLGSFQPIHGGKDDAFLMKISSSGTPVWSTYFGGPEIDAASSVCTDSKGNVFICGNTQSKTGISDTSAFRQNWAKGNDIMIAGFRTDGSKIWGTYYGGSGLDQADGICSDGANVFVCGRSISDTGVATKGAFIDTNYLKNYMGFILKIGDAEKGLPAPVSLLELNNDKSLQIWPNPASTSVWLSATGLNPETPAQIQVVSVVGNVLSTKDITSNSLGAIMFKVDLNQFAAGVYYLRLQSNTGSKTVQISKL